MSTIDEFDRLLDRFFAEGPSEIDDAVLEASLLDIQTIRQRRTLIGSRRTISMPAPRIALAAAVVVFAIVAPLVLLHPFGGVGGPAAPPTGAAASATVASGTGAASSLPSSGPSQGPSPSPFGSPTTFTSPTYRYSITLPAGWSVIPAQAGWDGSSAPGYDDPSVDQWIAPHVQGRCTTVFICAPTLWAFSGSTSLDLAAWVAARDAVADQQHPCGIFPSRTSIRIDGQPAVLEDGHCGSGGPFLLVAYTVRGGIGYAFSLQDNANEANAERLDRSDFNGVLATIRLGG